MRCTTTSSSAAATSRTCTSWTRCAACAACLPQRATPCPPALACYAALGRVLAGSPGRGAAVWRERANPNCSSATRAGAAVQRAAAGPGHRQRAVDHVGESRGARWQPVRCADRGAAQGMPYGYPPPYGQPPGGYPRGPPPGAPGMWGQPPAYPGAPGMMPQYGGGPAPPQWGPSGYYMPQQQQMGAPPMQGACAGAVAARPRRALTPATTAGSNGPPKPEAPMAVTPSAPARPAGNGQAPQGYACCTCAACRGRLTRLRAAGRTVEEPTRRRRARPRPRCPLRPSPRAARLRRLCWRPRRSCARGRPAMPGLLGLCSRRHPPHRLARRLRVAAPPTARLAPAAAPRRPLAAAATGGRARAARPRPSLCRRRTSTLRPTCRSSRSRRPWRRRRLCPHTTRTTFSTRSPATWWTSPLPTTATATGTTQTAA